MLADHQMTMCPHCLKCKLCPDDTSIDTVGTATKKQPQEMPGTGEATPKKQKLGECKKSTWKDNPNYNGKLKQLKQNIFQTHGQTNLGQLLQASNTTIPAALHSLGFTHNTCRWWTLWGGCGDPACTLMHLDKPLLLALVPKVSHLLSEGAAKLALSKAQT